jgi:uncharacterized cupin superfamily protein
MIQKLVVSEADYPDWPLQKHGVTIVEGNPQGRGKATFQTTDGLVSGGIWGCSEGVFELTYEWDEMAFILEGQAIIHQSLGAELNIKQGDFVFFPKGSIARWDIKEPVKKVFFLRSPKEVG